MPDQIEGRQSPRSTHLHGISGENDTIFVSAQQCSNSVPNQVDRIRPVPPPKALRHPSDSCLGHRGSTPGKVPRPTLTPEGPLPALGHTFLIYQELRSLL